MTNRLTPRQQKFVAAWQMGVDGTTAAKAAGYSEKSARYTAWSLLNENKAVMAEVAKVREQLADEAKYNGERCMDECNEGIAFAKSTKNANALARLIELKAKLTGLLIVKTELTIDNRIDINDALTAARSRAVRPSCDLTQAIEGQFVALPASVANEAPDYESVASSESAARPYSSPLDMLL